MRPGAWCAGGDDLGWGADSAGAEAVEGLLAAPRKVERITISYAQASKQVGMEISLYSSVSGQSPMICCCAMPSLQCRL